MRSIKNKNLEALNFQMFKEDVEQLKNEFPWVNIP